MKTLISFFLVQLLLLLLYPGMLSAQTKLKKRAITEIRLQYDSLHTNGFDTSFPIHLWAKRNNGKQASTSGTTDNTLRWQEFNIQVENGVFSNGKIHFNRKKINRKTHLITLTISPKNNPALQSVFSIPIPHLTSIVFKPYPGITLTPGYKYPLEIEGTYSNGQIYSTSKSLGKTHQLTTLDFKFNYLRYSSLDGNVYLPQSLQPYSKTIVVKGTYLADTSITTQIELPVSYTAHYTFNFVPEKANWGMSGENATGCTRRNGKDGQNGQHGQRGQRGKTVKVYAQSMIISGDTLIKLKAITVTQSYQALLHPQGKLLIDCRGGDGGDGGSGGDGSSGQDETEKEPAGYGGNGGNGGDGGDGGDGGKVIIYADSISLPFVEKMVAVENKGGKAGKGGKGGKRGRGGIQVKDTSFLTALGNLLGANSGSSGNAGFSGQDGEDGLPNEVIILPPDKLTAYF